MQASLKDLGEDSEYVQQAFVSHEDILNIPAFKNNALIAIKAPSGTRLEVPDPDEVRIGHNACNDLEPSEMCSVLHCRADWPTMAALTVTLLIPGIQSPFPNGSAKIAVGATGDDRG